MGNLFWSIIIVLVCFALQIIAFVFTQISRNTLRTIFPKNINNAIYLEEKSDGAKRINVGYRVRTNRVFNEILITINRYLSNNKGSADYAILSDITERNSDAVEAQIEATSAIPVYIGLCGTLIGIVLGVGVLSFQGGIEAIWDTETVNKVESLEETTMEMRKEGKKVSTNDGRVYVFSLENQDWVEYEDKGAKGIKYLLQGVCVAMLTTLIGVIFTIVGAWLSKWSSRVNEGRKNAFLSWLQAELLPKMTNDIGQVVLQMQRNLDRFNQTFSSNTIQLDSVLKGINTTYADQTRLLEAVDRLKIDEIATANIRVLQELKGCTNEIGELKCFVERTTEYVAKVDNLNGQITDHLDRTKLIENMGEFFKEEVTQIEQRKQAITRSVADVDLNMQQAFEGLRQHTDREYQKLGDALAEKHADFLRAIETQQEALNRKLEETSRLVEELKGLTAVKESMMVMAKEQQNQNSKIEILVNNSVEQNRCVAGLVDCVNKIASTVSGQNSRLDNLQVAVDKASNKTIDVRVPSPVIGMRTPVWRVILEVLICVSVLGLLGIKVYSLYF